MDKAWLMVAVMAACTPAPAPIPTPTPQAPTPSAAPAPTEPSPTARAIRVENPKQILDYIPTAIAGQPATSRRATSPTSAVGEWQIDGRAIRLEMSRIDDAQQTRAAFEVLGKPVTARMNGQELRGLRVQGNPAELSRDLSAPNRAALAVVAANTYLVTLVVSPSDTLDDPLPYADYVDIAGLTRLAIHEFKVREEANKSSTKPN